MLPLELGSQSRVKGDQLMVKLFYLYNFRKYERFLFYELVVKEFNEFS
jgi:hypothetical protein